MKGRKNVFGFGLRSLHDSSALKIVVGGLYSNRASSQTLTFCIIGKYRLILYPDSYALIKINIGDESVDQDSLVLFQGIPIKLSI